jgi:hypothetical protein
LAGQSELIETGLLIKKLKSNKSNPDYEKTRFFTSSVSNLPIDKITYVLDLNGVTNYSGIGFTNEDIKFEKVILRILF